MTKKSAKLISKILVLTMLLAIWSTFAACGASSAPADKYVSSEMAMDSMASNGFYDFNVKESDSVAMAPGFAEEAPQAPAASTQGSAEEVTEDYLNSQKLIYTCSLNIESLEFVETQQKIQELITQYGGFVESNRLYDNAYGWYYSSYEKTNGTLVQELRVRIPSEHYDAFVNGVSAVGKVQNKTENVQNITTQYRDTSTTVKSLQAQEERLLEMMAACTSIEDMITVERRLSEIQTKLEMYKTQLNAYDADIKFSTITIKLTEVKEYSPTFEEQTFFQRFAEHLKTTFEDFAAFAEGTLFLVIYLAPYAVIIVGIVLFICKIIAKKKAKKELAISKPIKAANSQASITNTSDNTKDISVQAEVGSKKKDKK